jgi:hypothetical protein
MKIVRMLLFVVLGFLLFGVGFYHYMGGFSQVNVSRESFGPTQIYFVTHKGPYKNLNVSWEKFQKDWESIGITECDSLAIYLDDPETEPEKLRSILGCRMDTLNPDQKKQVSDKFSVFTIPKMDCLTSEFPFKNIFSYFLAPNKVYPKFSEIIMNEKLETSVAIEIYGGSAAFVDKIKFAMPTAVSRSVFLPLEKAFE